MEKGSLQLKQTSRTQGEGAAKKSKGSKTACDRVKPEANPELRPLKADSVLNRPNANIPC
eukprot:6399153-Amphidinium_carterae.1